MGIDHGGLDVAVPQQFLHRPDVVAVLKQVRRKRVAKGVTADGLGNPGFEPGLFDGPL